MHKKIIETFKYNKQGPTGDTCVGHGKKLLVAAGVPEQLGVDHQRTLRLAGAQSVECEVCVDVTVPLEGRGAASGDLRVVTAIARRVEDDDLT